MKPGPDADAFMYNHSYCADVREVVYFHEHQFYYFFYIFVCSPSFRVRK